MNYEETKHRGRTGCADQQSSESIEGIAIESTGYRMHERGVWDITTTGVSLCARGRTVVKDVTSSRGERSANGKIACRVDKRDSEIKQEDESKNQWNNNRGNKGIPEATWDVERNKDRWSLSMSLIG